MSDLTVKTPATRDELIACLSQAGPGTSLLGGGTDLIIRMRDRGITRGTLIDLSGVAGLDRIETADGFLNIGANVTYARISEDPAVRCLPCLAEMASQIGSLQIRNLARLPGNIANASPAGDSIATLMALDARVQLLDGQGATEIRSIPEVVTGIGRTTLRPDQAITQVQIPLPGPGHRSRYGKLGMGARRQVVIANLSLTLCVDYDVLEYLIRDARVVLGSAAPVAFHAASAEALLRGRRPDPALGLALAAVLRTEVAASIKDVPMFQHKLNDVQGLALDLFTGLFKDEL